MDGTFPCVDGGISARPTGRQEPPAPLNGPRAAPPPFSPSSATNQDRRCVFPPAKTPRLLLRQAPVLPPPGLPSPRRFLDQQESLRTRATPDPRPGPRTAPACRESLGTRHCRRGNGRRRADR